MNEALHAVRSASNPKRRARSPYRLAVALEPFEQQMTRGRRDRLRKGLTNKGLLAIIVLVFGCWAIAFTISRGPRPSAQEGLSLLDSAGGLHGITVLYDRRANILAILADAKGGGYSKSGLRIRYSTETGWERFTRPTTPNSCTVALPDARTAIYALRPGEATMLWDSFLKRTEDSGMRWLLDVAQHRQWQGVIACFENGELTYGPRGDTPGSNEGTDNQGD